GQVAPRLLPGAGMRTGPVTQPTVADELVSLLEGRARVASALEQASLALESAEVALAEAELLLQAAEQDLSAAHVVAYGEATMAGQISPEEWRDRVAGLGDKGVRVAETRAKLTQIRGQIHEPALVARNAAGLRVSQLRGRLRAIDTQIEQVERDLQATLKVDRGRRRPAEMLRDIRDRLGGGLIS
ncbi:MAG: hypothetical protein LC797_18035, partial [Chloroflexi bacterium]|nr:hypothetical protein [Chloroflexota bacterium]